MGKFKLFTLVMALAAVMAFGATAQAAVNLETGTGAETFASELWQANISGGSGDILDTEGLVGFGFSEKKDFYTRFDLDSGAKFGSTDPDFTTTPAGVDQSTKSQGGASQTYVIYALTVAEGSNVSDQAYFLFGIPGITTTSATTVKITYRLYSDPDKAAAGGSDGVLYEKTATLLEWKNALVVAKWEDGTFKKIDVSAESKKFEGDSMKNLVGGVGVYVVSGIKQASDGSDVTIDELVTTGTKFEISGDFTALKDATDGTYDTSKLGLGSDYTCASIGTAATTISDTTATFDTDGMTVPSSGAGENVFYYICAEVNGETAIEETTFEAIYDVTPAGSATTSDVDLGEIGKWEKNGASDDLTFVQNPSTAAQLPFYVRITNTGSMSGAVLMTVWLDDGTTATFDIADMTPSVGALVDGELASKTSILFEASQVYNAAKAVNSDFENIGIQKMRARVEAPVVDGTLIIQGFSLDSSQSLFSQTTD